MSQFNIWNQTTQYHNQNLHQPPHSNDQVRQPQFNNQLGSQFPNDLSADLLIKKLNSLNSSHQYNNFPTSFSPISNAGDFTGSTNGDSFNNDQFFLPLELQGGLSNIQSRRPSYTADQITYNHGLKKNTDNNGQLFNSLESYVHHNNYHNNQGVNFRSRRPSIQFQPTSHTNNGDLNDSNYVLNNTNNQNPDNNYVELDNGLLLQNGFIISSSFLQKDYYENTKGYFCADEAQALYNKLQYHVQNKQVVQKIIINLKKLNNLFSLIKPLALILTKSGRMEILSTPLNSNLKISNGDVVISDGDRGKDLVYVLEANLNLELAILINYLKKKQHSRAISYGQANTFAQQSGADLVITNTVEDLLLGNGILDEETQFQIPSKQILRFATPNEITNLKFKLIEEIKTFKTAVLKINQNPQLRNSLDILTSEYQFDQKKLTFYYRASERLDFRNLIKELFKIYKTRIWLCAVISVGNNNNNSNNGNGRANDQNGQSPNNMDDIELAHYKNDAFHVEIFARLFDELLEL